MAITIKDIARHSGVSVSTVSRVLNKKPDVNAETAARVNGAIKELGYRPNSVARGLVLKRSNVIGFVVPDITNPNFPELARGVVEKARQSGYSVIFFDTNHDSKVEKEALKMLRSKQVDGIIVSFSEANQDEFIKLKEDQFPAVQIYRKSPKSVISTIAIDNVGSAYKAVKYLLSLGHRRIGHITTGISTLSGAERLEGYKKAFKEAGFQYREEWIFSGSHCAETGYEGMKALLSQDNHVTALFASHDLMAVGAYEAVFEKGLSIPGDISIIGHDNIEISRLVHPKLTTLDTFKDKLGQAGVELLLEEIAESTSVNREIIFKTELIVRDSTSRIG
ncbi:MAG: LacI family DNA-binding transcriptional regulator [Spirochaetales bacterium]|nr:LacI family DNA-binding transcriptional regulator [Spirochaetales bacterium]